MATRRRNEAIMQLDEDAVTRRRCGVCNAPTSITHVDLDGGFALGDCCVHELKQTDNLILAIGKSIGWDIFSTWENPHLNRREQTGIKFRASKPFQLD
jgi:hypothetical protein